MDVENLYQLVGQRIRSARQKAGISQAELAKTLGMSRASMVNIEAGRQRAPLHILWQVAEKLGIEMAALIPRRTEYEEHIQPISLSPEMIVQIEEAANGNPDARKNLIAVISKAKSKMET